MVTEKELDELYEEVKESRKMFEAAIDYEYIRESVEDILKAFNVNRSQPIPKAEKLIITMHRKRSGCAAWGWSEDGSAVLTREFCKLNANEIEYFKKLLQKYCNVTESSDVKWELILR